ncbi:nicotinate-nucleotide--dimethylbenzimidazole phosphoribosyltransferase [Kordiimonas sp. SCSIO 12603]|uniref:nicotinate-nucleotide--dimethylbenzimidazole phosphoribosyltransferase n=1 Tax=Kordiimonas sp. SCSIO 12603 TaxID=2829596 RepID=UPI002105BDB0|nr:nicotinate-nucleotide--dimethylbenzimidazole phosphoribosyltransferase [Kordiimonas sp. SCSIO 12603]UTW57592.1 nicotinate-nucleotide--dimethylbenzimidazole phosphoribosyltransferase [Kordiimonas sp. SCSIO 12603]
MKTKTPFEDLKSLLEQLPAVDACGERKVKELQNVKGSQLSELEEFSSWLAGWQGTKSPSVNETHICVLASSYSGYDAEAATAFIAAASKGCAPVNKLCVGNGIGLRVLEMAPEIPHEINSNWTESECMAAVAFGMEATAAGGHLLGLGSLAPGGEASSYTLIASCLGQAFQDMELEQDEVWIDTAKSYLAGLDNEASPLDVLRQYGGREIAASVGAIIAARSRRLPVLAEGWASLAAVVLLETLKKGACDHVKIAAAQDCMQRAILKHIRKQPLLNVTMPVDAGCSVAVAQGVMKASLDLLN